MLGRQDFFFIITYTCRLYAEQESDFSSACPNMAIQTLGWSALGTKY